MPKFLCTIVIPTRELFNGVVTHVSVPGELGSFGVLARHEKIVAKTTPGVVTVTLGDDTTSGEKRSFAIFSGVAQMSDDRLIVMGRMGCAVDEIDIADVQSHIESTKAHILELQASTDEVAASQLEVQKDNLIWYETQLAAARHKISA